MAALLLAFFDFSINDYMRFFKADLLQSETPNDLGTVSIPAETPAIPVSKVSPSFIENLPEGTTVYETVNTSALFSRLDLSALNLDEAMQTTIMKDTHKFGTIYEFSGGESVYFQIRSALDLILTESDSVYDANNLGSYSLYYNDSKREGTVFLLSLIKGRVWGFEYMKDYHENFKELTKTLVENEES